MNNCLIKEIDKRIKQLGEDVEKHPEILETIEAMKHWKEESIRKGFNSADVIETFTKDISWNS